MKNKHDLPSDYHLHEIIDLKANKKISNGISITFFVIAALLIGLTFLVNFPIKNSWNTGTSILVTIAMAFIYMITHELTHALFICILSKKKATFSFRFPYLITGSSSYFNKMSFIIIALSPVILLGIILTILITSLQNNFFLSLYILIGLNFAGSAGDYFQAYQISKLPSAALIQDNGKETKVFLPNNK